MATIKDIANRLGVSVSTVSKGLNGASDISDELRQMVLDTAVEMGYSTKRSKKVENRKLCIFIENMNYETIDEFGYDIVLGFKQNAFRRKWDVDILPITPAFQEEEKYDTFLLKNGYCGAFLMGLALHDSWIKQLENTTMPTVLFDNFISGNPNVCYLGTDSYEGITMAVNHLVNLGHKNIAFLNGSLYSLVSDQRQEAFESAMAAASLPVQKDLTAYGYYVSDSAKYHVPGFLSAGATAVVCGNDLIAKGVIDECTKRGFRVPEDVSIVGVDDSLSGTIPRLSLTTMRMKFNDIGREAFFMTKRLCEGLRVPSGVKPVVPAELVERGSVRDLES